MRSTLRPTPTLRVPARRKPSVLPTLKQGRAPLLPLVRQVSALCAGALLLASCARLAQPDEAPLALQPGAASVTAVYLAGRQQQLERRADLAIKSYQAVLRTDPQHVNASNGLATLYAERGELGKAIALWQDLTGRAGQSSGPGNAFLYSNLGYAYFLNGEYQHALQALEKACVLDPLNHRAWQHLGAALEKLGQDQRAQLMYKQARALAHHDFKTDYALAQRSGIAAIDSAVVATPAPDSWAPSELRQTASGIYELLRPVRGNVGAVSSAAGGGAQPGAPGSRLEVSNGNGVTGMARALARELGGARYQVVRVTNQKRFDVPHTRIEYQGAFRAAADALAARFDRATVVEVDNCKSSDLRLVIGRDLIRRTAAGAAETRPKVAAGARPAAPASAG